MTDALDFLVHLLDLETIEVNVYRGILAEGSRSVVRSGHAIEICFHFLR